MNGPASDPGVERKLCALLLQGYFTGKPVRAEEFAASAGAAAQLCFQAASGPEGELLAEDLGMQAYLEKHT